MALLAKEAYSLYNTFMYKYVFYDLDGTLLDTLPGIRRAINEALLRQGFPHSFSLKEAKTLIGDGSDALIRRSMKDLEKEGDFDRLKAEFLPLYREFQKTHSKPYNGMKEMVRFLSERGIKQFVVTNKPNLLATEVIAEYFPPNTFIVVKGIEEGEKVKPDPHNVLSLMEQYGCDPKECLYVGDSKTDLLTAENASLPLALCLWGYGFYKPELLSKSKYVCSKPKDLLKAILF